jgi:hypothetical protein
MRKGIVKTVHNTAMDLNHQIDVLNTYIEWFPGERIPLTEERRKGIFTRPCLYVGNNISVTPDVLR